MKTWIKFIFYLTLGFSSMATIGVGMVLLFEPESLKGTIFAGIVCLLCAIPSFVWGMHNGFNLSKW